MANCYLKIFFLMFIHFLRDREWVGEGQRERETQSKASSRLWALSTDPDVGLEPTNHEIMTWAEVGRSTDWATQAPLSDKILNWKAKHKYLDCFMQQKMRIMKCFNLSSTVGIKMRNTLVDSPRLLVWVGFLKTHGEIHRKDNVNDFKNHLWIFLKNMCQVTKKYKVY